MSDSQINAQQQRHGIRAQKPWLLNTNPTFYMTNRTRAEKNNTHLTYVFWSVVTRPAVENSHFWILLV